MFLKKIQLSVGSDLGVKEAIGILVKVRVQAQFVELV